MAESQPQTPALKVPRGRTTAGDIDYLSLTFVELAAEAAAWRESLTARGVRRGDRTLVMVRPGLPLIASVFALFQIGAVPVIIDPGMGLKNFLRAVAHSRPRALVAVPLARWVSRIFWRTFRSVEVRVPASGSRRRGWRRANLRFQISNLKWRTAMPGDLAAILFTSGSTGAPKGVCYEHGMFDAQVRLIRDTYNIQPGEIDLPLLPIFALFNPALGMTTIVPEIDPRHPAEVDPAKIVQAIRPGKSHDVVRLAHAVAQDRRPLPGHSKRPCPDCAACFVRARRCRRRCGEASRSFSAERKIAQSVWRDGGAAGEQRRG